MELFEGADRQSPAVNWLLANDRRIRMFVETVTPEDRIPRCLKIIETLIDYDPVGRGITLIT